MATADGRPFYPLPGGMRDLLPEPARRRRALARAVLSHLELAGYELVTLPAFELTAVLERGLGALDPAELLRFVDPESGQVAAFRPDMTPQIARLVATHLSERPPPLRLCYEGTVVRRRARRARVQRQLPQAGVELIGVPAERGDGEALALLASVLRAAGLTSFLLDLGHAGITRSLLDPLPASLAAEVAAALARKDAVTVERLVATAKGDAAVAPSIASALVALMDLHGGGPGAAAHRQGDRLLERGRVVLAGTPAAASLEELARTWSHAETAAGGSLRDHLRLDLGEARGSSYYTGVTFSAFAQGPGEPIAGGGRYDDLLGRFGRPLAAVGFALNLDALTWALDAGGATAPAPIRALVVASELRDADPAVEQLRALGVIAVSHRAVDAPADYARAWGFSHVVSLHGAAPSIAATSATTSTRLPDDPAACARAALAFIRADHPPPEGGAP